ncbi:MAG: class I SAM-dependent methyltransferase [bacterium]|nr:class I SAM-dependent methyltransferase [bacterium]
MSIELPLWLHKQLYTAAIAICRQFNPELSDLLKFIATDGALDRRQVFKSRLGIIRFLEYSLIMRYLALEPGMRVLDIGSNYRPFPLWVLSRGCHVYPTDIPESEQALRRYWDHPFACRNRERFHPQVQDGRQFTCSDGSFDRATCISVIEHIPEDEKVAAEIGRVLRPGGRAVLTFPVARESSLSGSAGGEWPVLRCYTEETMMKRIVQPSGLLLKKVDYYQLRRTVSYQQHLWFGAPLSLILFQRKDKLDESFRKINPLDTGILVLEKPKE